MSRFEEQQKDKTIEKEHAFQMNKMRREKQASLCFDLAKIVCAGLVVGNLSPIFVQETSLAFNIPIILSGIIITIGLIHFGNKLLTNNQHK